MDQLNVFISSTFFDLKESRASLAKEVKAMGHNPMTHESLSIFYDPGVHSHVACVQAVEKDADILVLVIGSRFGGEAVPDVYKEIDFEELGNRSNYSEYFNKGHKFSVTQLEVLKAVELNIPVLTFVDKSVYEARRIYQLNKKNGKDPNDTIYFSDLKENKYAVYIFEFINFINQLIKGNSILEFEYTSYISDYLKKYISSYTKTLIQKNRLKSIHHNNRNEIELLPVEFPCEQVVDYIMSISKSKKAEFIVDSYLTINEKGDGKYTISMKIKPADEHSHYAYEIFSDKPGKIEIEECRVVEFPSETVYIGIKKASHLKMNLLFKTPMRDQYTFILKVSVENFMSDLIERGEALLERGSSNGNKMFKKIRERIEFPDTDFFKTLSARIVKHPDPARQKKITPKRMDGKIVYEAVFSKKDKSTFNTETKIEFYLK